MARLFRFGVINEQMTTSEAWLAQARRVETLGYDTFLIRDHFVSDFFGAQFAPIAALTAAAMVTTKLRVGTMVIDNDFRHPALLAKEFATLDVMSGGRVELGLGAGWLEAEYRRTGYQYDPAGVRISRMEEALPILKGLLAGETVTRRGVHYQVDGLASYPVAIQRPHPPILIGGGGKRVLGIAGREADIVGILTTAVTTGSLVVDPRERLSARVAEKVGWVRDGAGNRFDSIELSMMVDVILTDDRRALTETYIAERGWEGLSAEDVWDMPAVVIGTPTEVADALRGWRERLGFSYIVVDDATQEAFAPIVRELSDR